MSPSHVICHKLDTNTPRKRHATKAFSYTSLKHSSFGLQRTEQLISIGVRIMKVSGQSTKIAWVLAMAIALPLSTANAEEKASKPKVEVRGKIYGNWGMSLDEDADNYNAFNVTRAYVTVKADVSESFATHVTTDIALVKHSDDTKLRTYLKYAYLEWKDPMPGLKVRFGAAGTGLISLHDEFTGRRWVEKSFTNRTEILASSDFGIHAMGKHSDGMFTYQASIVNGGGYSKVETDKAKTAQLRLTVDPLSGAEMELPISAFVSYGLGSEETDIVAAAAMGFGSSFGKAWVEFVMPTQGNVKGMGYMATLLPKIFDIGSLMLRYDVYDPNTDVDNDDTAKLYAGFTHDFAKKISAGLLYERETSHSADDVGAITDELSHGVFIKMQAGF